MINTQPTDSTQIVYLDQNKWILLAQARKHPSKNSEIYRILEFLFEKVNNREMLIPLTSSNIYETYKIYDLSRRTNLAWIQAILSQGFVFRARDHLVNRAIKRYLAQTYKLPFSTDQKSDFLSEIFFDAFTDFDQFMAEVDVSDELKFLLMARPVEFLYSYLVDVPDPMRRNAVNAYSAQAKQLKAALEWRRARILKENLSIRRRAYGALLLLEEINAVLQASNEIGLRWRNLSDIGPQNARRIISNVPYFDIERELVLKIEQQQRNIEENDFRDLHSFCSIIPFSDIIVAENHFSNIAIQAKLHSKYKTKITGDILELIRDT